MYKYNSKFYISDYSYKFPPINQGIGIKNYNQKFRGSSRNDNNNNAMKFEKRISSDGKELVHYIRFASLALKY
jgi:hypothetical protein